MVGLPGCSVPCGMSPDKMPMGMQLIGAWFADQTVLNAALAYQSRTEWHRHKPAGDR
jgi:aspartyl-tRNA(Asn)/glutamyl-tRNA(Gln) amidotransferase subunit A